MSGGNMDLAVLRMLAVIGMIFFTIMAVTNGRRAYRHRIPPLFDRATYVPLFVAWGCCVVAWLITR